MKDYHLIVVGDKKTPKDWKISNADYLSVDQQKLMGSELAKTLPYNHYCRKMLGYLHAIRNGAEYIVDTDDDNIPKENWKFPDFEKEFNCIPSDKGFINIYQFYTEKKIWPRGLPLNLVLNKFEDENCLTKKKCKVGIWQGLADEDPDVDAIYRLTNNNPCYFNEHEPIVLGKGTISPFNSQNTLIRKELFALLYLPTFATFRFTDILRGLIAQPIMWLNNYQLGFTNATVIQKRNQHDYMKDFISEIPMYQHSARVIEIVLSSIKKEESIESNLFNSYNSLLREKILSVHEIKTLESWLKDLQNS